MPHKIDQVKLDEFFRKLLCQEAWPLTEDKDELHERIISGKIAEMDEETYEWWTWENVGPPKADGSAAGVHYWCLTSEVPIQIIRSEPWMICWQARDCRYFGKRASDDEWDELLDLVFGPEDYDLDDEEEEYPDEDD